MAFWMAAVSSVVPSPVTPSVWTFTHSSVGGSAGIAGGSGAGSAFSAAGVVEHADRAGHALAGHDEAVVEIA